MDTAQAMVRMTARIPQSVQATLQQAAEISGSTLNQFLVQAAIEKAQQVIDADQIIRLSTEEADRIFELVDNPPAPNQKSREAMMQWRKNLGNEKI
jgi:uncharacterized protein (DUF1778 family)